MDHRSSVCCFCLSKCIPPFSHLMLFLIRQRFIHEILSVNLSRATIIEFSSLRIIMEVYEYEAGIMECQRPAGLRNKGF